MDYEGEFDWVELHRGEFPDAAEVVDEPGFCRRLRELDPQAQVIWNPRRQKWSLYRTVFHGAGPKDDLLRHEFDLAHPPGEWVIGEMRRRCLVRAGETSMDPKMAGRQFMKDLKNRIHRRRESQSRKWRECLKNVGSEWDTYVRRAKRSDVSARANSRIRAGVA